MEQERRKELHQMWGKGRLAEMTQAYLDDYLQLEKNKIYKKLSSCDMKEVDNLIYRLRAINDLELSLKRDYEGGQLAMEELEHEDS